MIFGGVHGGGDAIEQGLVGDLAGERADVFGQLAVRIQFLALRRIGMVLAETVRDARGQVSFGRFVHGRRSCTALAIFLLLATAGCDVVFDLQPEAVDARPDGRDPAVLQCPPNYEHVGASYYRRLPTRDTWAAARTSCILDEQQPGTTGRTHLVVVSDMTEYELVLNLEHILWVGLSDTVFEGSFAWVTDEPMSPMFPAASGPPWGNVEPNDANGNEDCASLKVDGSLNDANCLDPNWYVCECDAYGDVTDVP